MRLFGWVGDSAAVVDLVDGTPEGGLIVVADRSGECPEAVHRAPRLPRARRRPAGHHRHGRGLQRDEDHDRRPRRHQQAGRRRPARMCRCSRCRPATSRSPYAVTDQVVVIGSGPGFVKHVLDTTAGTSLASNDDYKKLVDRAGPTTGDDLRRPHRHPRGGREGRQRQRSGRATRRTRPTSSRSSSRSTRCSRRAPISGDLTKSVIVITVQ